MAKISLEKGLASVGVGVADVLVDKYAGDKTLGPLTATDAFRFALAVGSYAVNYLGYERDYSEAIFYSSLPLVTHSVADIVKRQQQQQGSGTAVPTAVKPVKITRVSTPAPVVISKPTCAIPP